MKKLLGMLSIAGIAAVALAAPASADSTFRPFYHKHGVWSHQVQPEETTPNGGMMLGGGGYYNGQGAYAPFLNPEMGYSSREYNQGSGQVLQ
ncbi:MAG: hypothetical protein R3D33_06110 [Hyphomicrobiaceae bacterium]